MYILMIFLHVTHEWNEKFVQKLVCHTRVNVKFKLSCTVANSAVHYSLLVFEIVFYNPCNITDGTYNGVDGQEGGGGGEWVGKLKVGPPCH